MKIKKTLTELLLIVVGSFFYAFGIALFLDPNELSPAGISGLAIVINHWIKELLGYTPLTTGTIIIIVNIPIFVLGIWKLGIKFFVTTILSSVLSSVFIDLLQLFFKPLTADLFLAAALGGAFMSFGIGLVFRAGATTGGSDIIVRVLRMRYKHIKTGVLFWFIDGSVVLISALSLGKVEVLLYAIVTLTMQTLVLDAVLYGADSAKLVYIVSDKQEEISAYLLTKLNAGATLLNAVGAYSGDNKRVVMCVVKKQQLPMVRAYVCEVDANAFLIVTKATEIYGNGFKEHNATEI